MGVKEYVQSEFDNVEAEIIAPNKDLFPGTITCDDFLWAFGVLRSRVFPELRGDKLALIPFADLVRRSSITKHTDMLIQNAQDNSHYSNGHACNLRD
jgi:[ribulose-bisphosphate carboxylase]-lysine N-methyltransferase